MLTEAEVRYNVDFFERGGPDASLAQQARVRDKRVNILFMCKGCGRCVEVCPASALEVVDDKCRVDHERCVLCGYCAAACPQLAIRLI